MFALCFRFVKSNQDLSVMFFVCVVKVGEKYPAPTQNQTALGGNLHPLQSLWTMERLRGESLLGAVVAGETATQGSHPHLANLVNSSFFLANFY